MQPISGVRISEPPAWLVWALVLFLAIGLLLAGNPAAAADVSPSRSPESHVVLTDPVGDNEGGLAPDITGLEIFNDAAGNITFVISFANRPQLLPEDFVIIDVDSDRNRGTGLNGTDYAIGHIAGAPPLLFIWNGTGFSAVKPLSGTFANGVLTTTVNRSELGNTEAFGFDVGATHTQGETVLVDFGPVGVYELDLDGDANGAPPPRKLAKLGAIKLLANGRVVAVAVRCLRVAQSPCKGNVKITATVPRSLLAATASGARTRTVTLGRAKFTIKPNKKKTVKVRLNKTGRKLVAKLRTGQLNKLRVVVKATAQDNRKLKTTDSKPAKLKLPKKKS